MPGENASISTSTALVTGASAGIGLELVKLLAADGRQLVLVARDQAKLQSLQNDLRKAGAPDVRLLVKDLSKPDACKQIADELAGQPIDVLINNAGFGVHGPVWEGDAQRQLDLLQVNIVALTHLTRLMLPGMIQRRRGRVMNLASVAAFLPGPLMAHYYASKAYVMSFSLALSEECRGRGVSVTAVCPGPTRTEFFTRAGIADVGISSGYLMSAREVAEIGYRAMLSGRPLVVTGLTNKLLAQSTRLLPRSAAAKFAGARNQRRNARKEN